MTLFINSLHSEWLKTKRSLASLLVIVGGFFLPAIMILIHILRPAKLPAQYAAADFWVSHFKNLWQSMAVMMLPMGIILAISLIAQLEFKNNTWKQLHATPQSATTIFFAKFGVILLMQLELFVLFTIGIYLSALIPSVVLESVPYPTAPIPYDYILRESAWFFLDSLPIVALQYLLSLLFRNFLVSVGAGLVLMVTGILMISWEYSYTFPYNYIVLDYLDRFPAVNLHLWAVVYFVVILLTGYILFLTKREKG